MELVSRLRLWMGSLAYYAHGTHSDQYRNSSLVRDLWYGTCD